jgi:hypothetical protein
MPILIFESKDHSIGAMWRAIKGDGIGPLWWAIQGLFLCFGSLRRLRRRNNSRDSGTELPSRTITASNEESAHGGSTDEESTDEESTDEESTVEESTKGGFTDGEPSVEGNAAEPTDEQNAAARQRRERRRRRIKEKRKLLKKKRKKDKLLRHAIVAFISSIFGIILVSLQILGLAFAITGRRSTNIKKVRWCSPSFLDFALAVTTGNARPRP